MPYRIRTMQAADIEAMIRVFDQVVSGDLGYVSFSELQEGVALDLTTLSPARTGIWRQELTSLYATYPEGQFVAVETDTDTVVGFQIVERVLGTHARFGVLLDLCVLPPHRHAGLGRLLFQAALDRLAQDGISRIFFESGINNTRFHEWVQQWGFRPIALVFMAEHPAREAD